MVVSVLISVSSPSMMARASAAEWSVGAAAVVGNIGPTFVIGQTQLGGMSMTKLSTDMWIGMRNLEAKKPKASQRRLVT